MHDGFQLAAAPLPPRERSGVRRRLPPLTSTPHNGTNTSDGLILGINRAGEHGVATHVGAGCPMVRSFTAYPIYQNVTFAAGGPQCYNVTSIPAKRAKTASAPPIFSADYIVRVKAQVMTRDDSSGGWVPMGGGGMSEVGLRKIVMSNGDSDLHHEYHIHGQKIADRSVVLNCVLKKDVQYIKANPTFHHWKTEEKRFGLTFQSSADARAFDKGVKRAVDDLVEGLSDTQDLECGDDEVFMTLELPMKRKDSWSQSASTASTTTSSPSPQSPSFSLHDTFSPPPAGGLYPSHSHLHRIHYVPRVPPPPPCTAPRPVPPPPPPPAHSPRGSSSADSLHHHHTSPLHHAHNHPPLPPQDLWALAKQQEKDAVAAHFKSDQGSIMATAGIGDGDLQIRDDFSYVEFNKNKPVSVHEYSYPTLECVSKSPSSVGTTLSHPSPVHHRRDSLSVGSKHHVDIQPPLPIKSKKKKQKLKKAGKKQGLLSQRSRCVYCHEMFVHDENFRGNCEDAPDKVGECIEKVSCICCARSMMYHCMADADGDYGHPCVCDTGDTGNCKKWTALTILSLFVPCLWCYWPLSACHRCGVACACCGGRHKAA